MKRAPPSDRVLRGGGCRTAAGGALGTLPTFKDSQTQRLSTQLEDLYPRREQLTIASEDTGAFVEEKLGDPAIQVD